MAEIDALQDQIDGLATSSQILASDLSGLLSEFQNLSGVSSELAKAYTGDVSKAMRSVIVDGKSLSDVFHKLALTMADKTLHAAVNPIIEGASQQFGNIMANFLPFRQGGVIQNGVEAYADGGVVSAPSVFAMRSGLGVMGEAGPEAILPLKRGNDGKLGVAFGGGASPINITFQISTPNVDSFYAAKGQISNHIKDVLQKAQSKR